MLHDESTQPTQLLRNALPAKVPIREIEAVADCNCDRWGHPFPGCVERIARPTLEVPISMPTKK